MYTDVHHFREDKHHHFKPTAIHWRPIVTLTLEVSGYLGQQQEKRTSKERRLGRHSLSISGIRGQWVFFATQHSFPIPFGNPVLLVLFMNLI